MKVVKNFDRVIKVPAAGVSLGPRDREKIRPEMKERVERVLITGKVIRKRLQALARDISQFYQGDPRIELIFVLEGASTFAANLAQEIFKAGGPEIRMQSIKARTYGTEIKENGETVRPVKIFSVPPSLVGGEVLLVEDIIDQGFTLSAVKDWLVREAGAREVKICALLDKKLTNPSPQVKKARQGLKPDWIGFEIPDRWVAGFGVDAGDDFRFLPFVVTVREEYYRRGGTK
jgi:hypoxanthine phosphoribosyltransferase